jgi:hypothetical protein
MPIKLKNLNDIATIIKTKYGDNLSNMNFIFCFKQGTNSYFIFQEFQGMPIKRIVYHESNNSVTFVASWSAWSSPYSLVADANFEKIENWKDLQDRSRPYNSYIEEGGFNKSMWTSVNRKNKTEKKKKHKNKLDTFVEFRVDRIRRANFNAWGFELYSNTISMIGFHNKSTFPYNLQDVEGQYSGAPVLGYGFNQNAGPPTDDDGVFSNRVTWQGGSFDTPEFESDTEQLIQLSSNNEMQLSPGGSYWGSAGFDSYWDHSEHDEENDLFDEEMYN